MSPGRGALVTSLRVEGRELLFLDEGSFLDAAKNVRGGVPVLFPSPGRLTGDRYTRGGASGELGQHGFARNLAFDVVDRAADSVRLRLDATAATRAAYPFEFSLMLAVRVAPGRLLLDATVENRDDRELPFGLGYHPYFVVPAAKKASARVPTQATRAFDNVTKALRPLERVELGEGEVDLHLLDHGAARGELSVDDGTVVLDGDDAWKRWVVWTLPGRDFVCVEPWTSPADALNTGEDLLALAPGASRTLSLAISWVPAASAAR